MWLSRQMKAPAPTADADLGMTTITGDSVGVVTRGEVRALPVYGPGGYVWMPESGAAVLVIKGGPGGEEQCVEVPHSGGVKEAIMASPALAEAVKREEEALAGAGRVLVRPSGTEALIRVMVEAKTTQIAQAVADRLADFIKSQKK